MDTSGSNHSVSSQRTPISGTMDNQHRTVREVVHEPAVMSNAGPDIVTPEEDSNVIANEQEPTRHAEQDFEQDSDAADTSSSNISEVTTQILEDASTGEHERPNQEEPIATTSLLPEPNQPSPFAKEPRSTLSRYLSDWWLMESLSWVICALSIIAIVIILRVYDQKRLPQWPLSITINTAISLFATISQMAMLVPVTESISQLKWIWFTKRAQRLSDLDAFDQASRGPWGSLLLIAKLRGLHLAALGSFITIMALAFGPFTQQVVTYPLRMVPNPSGNATVARAQNYTVTNDLGLDDEEIGIPDPTMKSAIYNGLFLNDNDTIPSLVPTCSTGNCTWPTYYTLGLCAEVADITNLLEHKCVSKNIGQQCIYTLPNNVSLDLGDIKNMIISPRPEDTTTISFPGANVPILDFFIITTDLNASGSNYGPQSSNDWDIYSGANAWECSVRFCVQSVNTSVTNGQHITTQTEIWSNASLENPTLSRGSYYELWLRPKDAAVPYVIPQETRDAITTWSKQVFTGDSTGGETGNSYSTDAVQMFVTAMQVQPRSEHIVAVSNILRNIALSMTNNIRTYGKGAAATGTAFTPETFVSIQWAWLSLPLSLIALSLVLLAATVLKGNRRKTRVWKSSSMAVLQGLSVETHRRLGALDHVDVMDELAGKMRVTLAEGGTDGDEGWRLAEVQGGGSTAGEKEKVVRLWPWGKRRP